jgi:hypothetical protein
MMSKTKDGKRGFVSTLNGSGLPIRRTLGAILEQGQRSDGSVQLPDALAPYLGYGQINHLDQVLLTLMLPSSTPERYHNAGHHRPTNSPLDQF